MWPCDIDLRPLEWSSSYSDMGNHHVCSHVFHYSWVAKHVWTNRRVQCV